MSAINILKSACANKPIVSFKNLAIGNYVVMNFRRVNTKFGERIRIETIDSTIFLPDRFSSLLNAEHIAQLNTSLVIMSYKGVDSENNNRVILDFDGDLLTNVEAVQAA